MKILVIGGTGHIGRFLTPMLVRSGHEVSVMSRGQRAPGDGEEWSRVNWIRAAYTRGGGEWTRQAAGVGASVVIDILGADVPTLYESVRETCEHLVCCGSVWMLGTPKVAPTPEIPQSPCPFEGYRRRFAELQAVQSMLAGQDCAFTAILPPNICGPGKIPLEPRGGRDIEAHRAMMRGEEVVLPFPGNNLIGPCDAEDIARAFLLAVENRDAARGEFFNVGSAYALTAEQFVRVYGDIYGQSIPIRWVGYREFVEDVMPSPGAHFHFTANMCPSIAKIRERLGYEPWYTPEQTMERAVSWMRETGLL